MSPVWASNVIHIQYTVCSDSNLSLFLNPSRRFVGSSLGFFKVLVIHEVRFLYPMYLKLDIDTPSPKEYILQPVVKPKHSHCHGGTAYRSIDRSGHISTLSGRAEEPKQVQPVACLVDRPTLLGNEAGQPDWDEMTTFERLWFTVNSAMN